jgi:selenocysteine lyase/cysteine desulfurase
LSKTDWRAIRAEFPALAQWTFLNSATFGQLPRRASEAVARHFAHRDALACADFLEWYDDADRLRESIARLIHTSAEDIAFVPSAAAALGMLCAGLPWKPGDRIVTLVNEFPNQLYLAARRGIEFVEVEYPDLWDAVDEHTRLVAVSEVNYASGFRVPIAELSTRLRERGVLLYVDGTQSVGALEFNCSVAKPDMLAVHGYKWMLSPTGAGFMYVAPELRERLDPMVIGWRSHENWRNVDNLHHGSPVFKESAEKYEGGGLQFPLLYAMEESVNMMLEIGPDVIERRVLELACALRSILRAMGAEVDDTGSQIVAARFSGRDVSKLARALREKKVLVSARHGYLRVSPHIYNDESDLQRLRSELSQLL